MSQTEPALMKLNPATTVSDLEPASVQMDSPSMNNQPVVMEARRRRSRRVAEMKARKSRGRMASMKKKARSHLRSSKRLRMKSRKGIRRGTSRSAAMKRSMSHRRRAPHGHAVQDTCTTQQPPALGMMLETNQTEDSPAPVKRQRQSKSRN